MSTSTAPQRTPGPPASKASAASPKVTAEDVELTSVQNGDATPSIPLAEDVMQCARIGALKEIQDLIRSGKYDAKYKDEENITPLHWAAINNHYAVCKYLIEQGADVNAKGGEQNATPAMWAAQRCHLYIVQLLLESGTDPMLVDGQGYNIIHLATIDGNTLLLALLLHQNIPVDVTDQQGHTSLMWAAYRGWPACVDLLLRWGASVKATDDNKFTPLHWALVKGSKPCLEKIIEYGADRFAETNERKTPAIVAEEMKSTHAYRRALADHGYDITGHPKQLPLNLTSVVRDRSKMSKFFFLFPFFILFVVFYVVSKFTIYIGLPLSLAASFACQYVATYLSSIGPLEYQTLHRTPFLAGVFAGTLFWVGATFFTAILPLTFSTYPISNLLFVVAFSSTAYFYSTALLEDPGYVPKLNSRNQQRLVISELFQSWKFDEDNFCIQCLVRKPLRSKHCRRCGRCVAKHDHHCPWINSCVGNNNLRHFFIYIISLEIGIIFFVRLALAYLQLLPAPSESSLANCHILPPALCTLVLRDSWTVALSFWAALQLIWVTMLLVVQTVQISRAQTTYENMRSHNHVDSSHSHHRPHGIAPSGEIIGPGTASHDGAGAAASLRLPAPQRKPDSWWTRWKKLLGLDAFSVVASDASAGNIINASRGNPFSRGVVGNCKDFWCDSAPIFGQRNTGEGFLGGEVVDYHRMYEAPLRTRGGGGMRYRAVGDGEGELEADEDV